MTKGRTLAPSPGIPELRTAQLSAFEGLIRLLDRLPCSWRAPSWSISSVPTRTSVQLLRTSPRALSTMLPKVIRTRAQSAHPQQQFPVLLGVPTPSNSADRSLRRSAVQFPDPKNVRMALESGCFLVALLNAANAAWSS